MGFTAIWPCPLLTNDMASSSYHGYAITDLYQIDPRFGQLQDYLDLSEQAAERGIKIIMDQVGAPDGSVTMGDTLSVKVYQALSAAVQMRPPVPGPPGPSSCTRPSRRATRGAW